MEKGVITLVLLIIGIFSFSKIKSWLFKTSQDTLIKEDETLKSKETVLKTEIEELKKQKPQETLTPEQVEDFWKKK